MPNTREPAYQRIQHILQEAIRTGELSVGDAVPSERELARRHDVSLMTARHALHALELLGLVERRRGSGTFVAPLNIRYNKLQSTTELMSSRGLSVRSEILQAGLIDPQPEVAARLSVATHTPLLKVERLRRVGTDPLALETTFLSANEFGDLMQRWSKTGSLFTTIEKEYGQEIAYSDEEIDATTADVRVAQLLHIAPVSPILRIRQVFYTRGAKPFMYVMGLYRSDRHTLFLRRFRY